MANKINISRKTSTNFANSIEQHTIKTFGIDTNSDIYKARKICRNEKIRLNYILIDMENSGKTDTREYSDVNDKFNKISRILSSGDNEAIFSLANEISR